MNLGPPVIANWSSFEGAEAGKLAAVLGSVAVTNTSLLNRYTRHDLPFRNSGGNAAAAESNINTDTYF